MTVGLDTRYTRVDEGRPSGIIQLGDPDPGCTSKTVHFKLHNLHKTRKPMPWKSGTMQCIRYRARRALQNWRFRASGHVTPDNSSIIHFSNPRDLY